MSIKKIYKINNLNNQEKVFKKKILFQIRC